PPRARKCWQPVAACHDKFPAGLDQAWALPECHCSASVPLVPRLGATTIPTLETADPPLGLLKTSKHEANPGRHYRDMWVQGEFAAGTISVPISGAADSLR